MYVITDGEVKIQDDENEIDHLEEGDIFGEMALVDSSPRSATAVAHTNCKIVLIDQKRFEFLVHNHPHFAVQIMTVMSDRLRRRMEI